MAQSNRGVLAVVGGGCALGLVLALGYLLYWMPKQKAEAAKDEVRAWSENWHSTLNCLLGEPSDSSPHRALLARELTTPRLQDTLGGCIDELKALRRGEGYSSENEAIEVAWHNVQVPVANLAKAHAWFTASEPNKTIDVLRRNLSKAIEGAGLAHDALREAGLGPSERMSKIWSHATEVRKLLGPGGKPADISEVRLEGPRITYVAHTEAGDFRAQLDEAQGERFWPLSPLALRAIESDWGMWVEEDGIPVPAPEAQEGAVLRVGPLDDVGEPAADGVELMRVGPHQRLHLSFAIGDKERVLLFRVEETDVYSFRWHHTMMRSTDAGATWAPVPLPDKELWVQLRASALGNYISWEESPSSMALHFQALTREGSDKQLLTFTGNRDALHHWPPEMCQAETRSWWVVDGAVYSRGTDKRLRAVAGSIIQDTASYEQTLRCTDDALSVSSQKYQGGSGELLYQHCSLERCQSEVRRIHLPEQASYHLVHHKGQWHALTILEDMVAVWVGSETEAPAKIAAFEGGAIYGAMSQGEALMLLAWPEEAPGPSLLALP